MKNLCKENHSYSCTALNVSEMDECSYYQPRDVGKNPGLDSSCTYWYQHECLCVEAREPRGFDHE